MEREDHLESFDEKKAKNHKTNSLDCDYENYSIKISMTALVAAG
jgi:hypothetical protein